MSFSSPYIILVAAINSLNHSRFAVVASRAVGLAVQRNRAKRQMRACLQAIIDSIIPGWDLIFYARQPIVNADFLSIQKSIIEVLRSAKLIPAD